MKPLKPASTQSVLAIGCNPNRNVFRFIFGPKAHHRAHHRAELAAAARTAAEDASSSARTFAKAAAKARNEDAEAAAIQNAEEEPREQLTFEADNAESEATYKAKQDAANERFRATLVTWKAKEQRMRQNMRPVERGQARKEVAIPGQISRWRLKVRYFWCVFQVNERSTRSIIRTLAFEPPSQVQSSMAESDTKSIQLNDQKPDVVRHRANQPMQLRRAHRLGTVLQIEPKENGQVRIHA